VLLLLDLPDFFLPFAATGENTGWPVFITNTKDFFTGLILYFSVPIPYKTAPIRKLKC
jgi:hypothetical protein